MLRHSGRRIGFGLAVIALVSGAGLMLRAEPPQEVGTWASIGASPEDRVGATSVALPDGRTVIAGGLAGGIPTDAVVLFDPETGSFSAIGQLTAPRTGHTATLLEDGRIVIAGGTVNELLTGDIEIYDLSTGTATLAATMTELRSGHAAARLPNGSVLIAGGIGPNGGLQSAEIFDPAAGTSAVTSPLLVARTSASATSLIDGRVLIAGGSDGTQDPDQDLASAEIFDPASQSFQPTDTNLAEPRSGHTAVLLPHNNSVLIAGGSSNGMPLATVELFLPAEFPDPFSYGMGQFTTTDEMAAPRSGAAGGPHVEGYAYVTGGGAANAEVYRFATIKTDKDDYAPGELAVITGSGWQANEQVTLLFQEDPAVHADYALTVMADDGGNIFYDQWAPEEHDLGVRFYLMAAQQSLEGERRAQTTFTDGVISVTISSPTTATPTTITSLPDTVTIAFNYRTNGNGGTINATASIKSGSTTIASNSKPVARANGGGGANESIVVTIPVGTANGSYTVEVTVDNPGGTGNPDFFTDEEASAVVIAANVAPNVPASLAQFKSNGTTSIAVGGATNETTVVLKGTVSDPDSANTVKLQVEVQPVGTPFTNTFTAESALVANGNTASATVAGLVNGTNYHWQARTVDNSSAASAWGSFGGNLESDTDFRVDTAGPSVTINQAAAQADPTNAGPILFAVEFSEPVTGFSDADVTLSGTAGATTALVSGSGASYTVSVSGMTQTGTVTASIAADVAPDGAGNLNTASTSTDNTVTYDITPPDVTINQAGGQADPTNDSPILFTVEFSEPVADFTDGDLTLSGTAGATTAVVSGSGASYTVSVSGMTQTGTVIASIAAGVASDAAGNGNTASTSTDNTVTYDITPPDVTINQAATQADPTNAEPILFTVEFSEPVTLFTDADVTLSGTAGATTAVVSGSGANYTVTVSGMSGDGTVIASIAANMAHDAAGNANTASTSTDNTVTYDGTPPDVTINQAMGQADPTNASPINFTVVFSEPVTGFINGDVTLSGTAGATTAVVTGSGTTYNVAVSGMTSDGTVVASIAAGAAADAAGNISTASTSTDNTVTYDATPPNVTIDQAATQADPTNDSPIVFTVEFSEPVTGFTDADVTLAGTAGATTALVSGSGANYTVEVSGMTQTGTVIATIAAGVASDPAGNGNIASTSTDNTVTYDITPPDVTINQAATQADPTNAEPILFTVEFSEPVTGFADTDVTLTGTAGATTAVVTGSGASYTVSVSGLTTDGTVIASIAAGVASDAAGNGNTASTSTDNTVTYDITPPDVTIDQALGQDDPTNGSPINFTVVFTEPVTGLGDGDVTLGGTAGATTAVVTGSGTTYNVAVSGMTQTGSVTASIAAGVASDAAGNGNTASTSTDNEVTYDITPPDVTIDQAGGQADPTNDSPILFAVEFSEPVNGFSDADITLSGTAGATTAVVSGSGASYTVSVSGMTQTGTVIASIAAGVAADAAGNGNTASTSADNTVTYDITPPDVTINQAMGQADPTNASPITFTVEFSEPVTLFTDADVTLSGTAGATTAVVSGTGASYTVAVSGMTQTGTVIASIAADVAVDAAGNGNTASTSADNTVTYDITPPDVTINQATGQVDPTNASPILFTVEFSEPVADFTDGDLTLSGTAGATTAVVFGSGASYTVSVSGMTGDGTVVASIAAGVASDAAGNLSTASTSTDNSVVYDTTAPTGSIIINSNSVYTNNPNVTLALTCLDAMSSCVQMQFSQDGSSYTALESFAAAKAFMLSGADGVKTVYVRFKDSAGNVSGAFSDSIVLDTIAPAITLNPPQHGGTYLFNQVIAADYACTDTGGSGVASCTGTVADGANFSTSPVGPHTFTVNAQDNAGNVASVTHDYTVTYAPAGTMCLGSPGHQVLQPLNVDGSSVVKRNSTVPVKFRVCDAAGISIGTPGVVTSFQLIQVINGTVTSNVNEDPVSTTPDMTFRWDAGDKQWIFNLNTKNLQVNRTYIYTIGLNDGTYITFQFGTK